MSNLQALTIATMFLIPFAAINAEIAESVSTYQLDAAYECQINGAECRGEYPNRIIISSTDEA